MESEICVVFAVGRDIVERLQALSPNKIMDFILGHIENDYFGNHFWEIEDIGECGKSILKKLETNKDTRVSLIEKANLYYQDEENLVILQNTETIRKILQALESVTIKEGQRDTEQERMYYIERIKELCRYTLLHEGMLLFCMETI